MFLRWILILAIAIPHVVSSVTGGTGEDSDCVSVSCCGDAGAPSCCGPDEACPCDIEQSDGEAPAPVAPRPPGRDLLPHLTIATMPRQLDLSAPVSSAVSIEVYVRHHRHNQRQATLCIWRT